MVALIFYPFGDNFTKEVKIINDVTVSEYTLTKYVDPNTLENSLLVYHVRGNTINKLLLVDEDFTIDNSIPPKITLLSDIVSRLLLDDNLVFKFYDKDPDSAECSQHLKTWDFILFPNPR